MPAHFSIQLTAMATYDLRSHELASVWSLRIIAKTNIWHIAMTVIRLDVPPSSYLGHSSTLEVDTGEVTSDTYHHTRATRSRSLITC